MLSVTSSQAASLHYPAQNGSVCTQRRSAALPQQQQQQQLMKTLAQLPSASVGVRFHETPRPRSDWRRWASTPPTAAAAIHFTQREGLKAVAFGLCCYGRARMRVRLSASAYV